MKLQTHPASRAVRALSVLLLLLLLWTPSVRGQTAPSGGAQADSSSADSSSASYMEAISGTMVEFEMVRVPAGAVTVETPDGAQEESVEAFWMSATEIPWDAYDVFVYGLDKKGGGSSEREVDAVSYPSKPYVLPGEDFGHEGYPALAMTRKAAEEFGRWLSAKTGKNYRLPTEAEWTHACRMSLSADGADADQLSEDQLAEYAWFETNADDQTHPVGSLEASALGLHDMLGNVAELVAGWSTDADSPPVVRGGSFESAAAEVSCAARQEQTSAWKAMDPQLPKSQWWLSDAPFVGFRLVREPERAAP